MPRQVISLLFTDIVDSTALFTSLGADRADLVRSAHDRAVTRSVEAAGGTVVKHLGDGFMATFPGPSAAFEAAIGSQRAISRAGERLGVDLAIRAGISLGEATQEGDDWFGPSVVEAARLCAAAGAGEILVADRAVALGSTPARLTSMGELDLKGLGHPVAASRLTWQDTPDRPVPLPANLRPNTRLPFVGREAAARQLHDQWTRAVASGGGIVLVAGEPGIGKSRLVAEFAATAWADGATVAYGRCDQDALFPYQPFVEAIRHLHAHGAVAAAAGIELLLPNVGPGQVANERSRGELLDATGAALRDAAGDRPLVLVLDDLHWADLDTVAMLRHVLRDLSDTPLLVVGTYRDTDIGRTHPFGALLVELRREHDVPRIHLSGLDDDAVFDLLAALAQNDLDPGARQLARRLTRETSGNPFFVGEVLAHLAESGVLVNEDGRWSTTADVAELGLPEGVRDVVGQRLSRLSPSANAMLTVVAVGGRSIDLSVLRDTCGTAVDDVVAAVEEAVGAGLLVEEEGPVPRYGFAHALVRQTLLDEVTAARALRTHATFAEVLASRASARPESWLEAVHHAIEGAPLLGFDRTCEILGSANASLLQVSAPDAVVGLARRLDAVGRELGAPAAGPWCSLLCLAGASAFVLGDRDTAGEFARRALTLSRELDEPHFFVDAVSALSHAEGFGLDPAFLALLPEALALSVPGTFVRVKLLAQQLAAATSLGHLDVAAAGQELMREAELVGTEEALAVAHSSVASSCQAAIPATTALHHATRAMHLGEELGSWRLLDGMLALPYAVIRLGRDAEARVAASALSTQAEELGATLLVAAGHQQLAVVDLVGGDLEAARFRINEVSRFAPNEPMFQLGCIVQHMWLAHLAGDHEAALRHMDGLDGLPYPEIVSATRGWLAGLAGHHAAAGAAADQMAATDIAGLPTSWVSPGLWMTVGHLALQQARPDLAVQVVPLLERLTGERVIYVCNFVIGDADDMLAELRELIGGDQPAEDMRR